MIANLGREVILGMKSKINDLRGLRDEWIVKNNYKLNKKRK